MSGLPSLIRRELRGYFNTPLAYVVIVGFLLFTSGWLFIVNDFFAANIASLRGYFGIMPVVLVVLVPATTMRAWAEERRTGADEILFAEPLGEGALVLGKFVASLAVLWIAVGLTAFVPLTVAPLGDFERGEIVGQYAGLLLLVCAAAAVGQLGSAVTRNQVSAFIVTALILLALVLVGRVNAVAQPPSWLSSIFTYLSIDEHFRSFNRGVFDTRDAAYFVVLTGSSLFLTARVIVLRKLR
ncbi:MAG: ABC transporter permease [bacterium]